MVQGTTLNFRIIFGIILQPAPLSGWSGLAVSARHDINTQCRSFFVPAKPEGLHRRSKKNRQHTDHRTYHRGNKWSPPSGFQLTTRGIHMNSLFLMFFFLWSVLCCFWVLYVLWSVLPATCWSSGFLTIQQVPWGHVAWLNLAGSHTVYRCAMGWRKVCGLIFNVLRGLCLQIILQGDWHIGIHLNFRIYVGSG